MVMMMMMMRGDVRAKFEDECMSGIVPSRNRYLHHCFGQFICSLKLE